MRCRWATSIEIVSAPEKNCDRTEVHFLPHSKEEFDPMKRTLNKSILPSPLISLLISSLKNNVSSQLTCSDQWKTISSKKTCFSSIVNDSASSSGPDNIKHLRFYLREKRKENKFDDVFFTAVVFAYCWALLVVLELRLTLLRDVHAADLVGLAWRSRSLRDFLVVDLVVL